MTSIIRAITWEFWRENRWWIIISACAILGLGRLVYDSELRHYDPEHMSHLTTFFAEMIAFGMFLCLSLYNKKKSRLGFPEHLFIKPVRMRFVASLRLGLAVVTAVSLYVVTAWVFLWTSQVRWPIALPCLYLATCIVFLHAMAWSLSAVPGLQVIFSVMGYFVLCTEYYHSLHAHDFSGAPGLFIYMMLWTGLAITGAALDRRAQRLTLTALWNRILKTVTACLPWKTCTDASPQRALFWFHWIRKGWILPILSIFLMGLGYGLLWSVTWKEQAAFIADYFSAIFLVHVFAFPLLIGLVMCQQETQNQGLPTHVAPLPVTNRDMLMAYFKASLASLTVAWGVFLTGLCLLQICLLIVGKGSISADLYTNLISMIQLYNPRLDSEANDLFQIRTVYFLIAWAVPGLLASMVLTGRRSVAAVALSCALLLPAIPAIARIMDAPGIVVKALYILETCLFVVCVIGGTITAYVYGTLTRRISPYLTLAALLICITVNIINAEVIWQRPGGMLGSLAELAAVTLALAPLATAPLALAWNRHR